MTYEFYNKQPMHMTELNFIMVIHNNPHLISAIDGNDKHSLVGKE